MKKTVNSNLINLNQPNKNSKEISLCETFYRTMQVCPSDISACPVNDLIAASLNRKYALAEVQCSDTLNFELFLAGASRNYSGGLLEFKKCYEEMPRLKILNRTYKIK